MIIVHDKNFNSVTTDITDPHYIEKIYNDFVRTVTGNLSVLGGNYTVQGYYWRSVSVASSPDGEKIWLRILRVRDKDVTGPVQKGGPQKTHAVVPDFIVPWQENLLSVEVDILRTLTQKANPDQVSLSEFPVTEEFAGISLETVARVWRTFKNKWRFLIHSMGYRVKSFLEKPVCEISECCLDKEKQQFGQISCRPQKQIVLTT